MSFSYPDPHMPPKKYEKKENGITRFKDRGGSEMKKGRRKKRERMLENRSRAGRVLPATVIENSG